MIQAIKVIEALGELHPPAPTWASDVALQAAIEARLRHLGVAFMRRPPTNGGFSELVVDCVPNLLLQISLSGEVSKVSAAAAQLSIHRKALPLTRPIMAVGSPLQHVTLEDAIRKLDIILVQCS